MTTDLEVLNLLKDDLDFMPGDDITLISPDKNRNRRFIKVVKLEEKICSGEICTLVSGCYRSSA